MYCSNCGQSLNGDLNYCNSCGTKVERKAPAVSNSLSKPIAFAAIVIGGGGLFAFVPLLRELLRSSLDQALILIILVAYLLTVVLMFSVLIGNARKYLGEEKVKGGSVDDAYVSPASFRSVNTAQLNEPRDPPDSVTDHTTRMLENVQVKR
jgi:hypothetical protein